MYFPNGPARSSRTSSMLVNPSVSSLYFVRSSSTLKLYSSIEWIASWTTVPIINSLNSSSESETALTKIDGFMLISFLFLLLVLPRLITIFGLSVSDCISRVIAGLIF